MGVKLIQLSFAFTAAQVLAALWVLFDATLVTFNVVTGAGLARIARVQATLWTLYIDQNTQGFWTYFKTDLVRERFANGGVSLMEGQTDFCVDAVRHAVPSLCEALQAAYMCGLIWGIALVIGMLLAALSVGFRYEYMSKKQKKMRKTAMILDCVSCACIGIALMLHLIFAVGQLTGVVGRVNIALSISRGIPLGLGYVVAVLCPLFQFTAAILTWKAKFSIEDTVDEVKGMLRDAKEQSYVSQAMQISQLQAGMSVPGDSPFQGVEMVSLPMQQPMQQMTQPMMMQAVPQAYQPQMASMPMAPAPQPMTSMVMATAPQPMASMDPATGYYQAAF